MTAAPRMHCRLTHTVRMAACGMTLYTAGCRQLLDDFHVVGGDAGEISRCDQPGYPSPPPPPRGTLGGTIEFTVALRTLDWGDRVEAGMPTYSRVGFNLDGKCTTSRATSSCLVPAGAAISQFSDGPGGVDNASGHLAWQLQGANAVTEAIQADETAGRAASLLRVRGYNGTPDDDRVEAALFVGTRQPSSSAPPAGPAPAWDGGDSWSVSSAFLKDGASIDLPAVVDSNAYVRGGTLVVRLSEALQGGPFRGFSTMPGFVLTGTIVPRDGSYGLQGGVRGGRWPVGKVLSYVANKLSGSPCAVPSDSPLRALYEQGKGATCTFADIRAEGDDPSSSCDALSFGVAFDGVPANIGGVVPTDGDPACPEDSCSLPDAGRATADATTAAP